MTALMLCAIVPGSVASADTGLEFVAHGDLAAALWGRGETLGRPQDKRAFARALLEQQRALEALAALGPVLPAAPGTMLAGRDEALSLLAANAECLSAALAEHGAKRQWQVRIDWDLAVALRRHAQDPEVRAAVAGAGKDRLAIGRALQRGMEAVRQRLRHAFEAALAEAVDDRLALPVESESGLMNLVVAVAADGDAALERALEVLDAEHEGALKIRLIGPLPVVSFAALRLERPAPKALAAARARLGVDERATLEDIAQAFRAKIVGAHPDRGGDGADETVAARDLLVRVVAACDAVGAVGAARTGAPPLALVRRDGEAERAA